jgi:uncharacterized membrane protein
MSLAPLLNASPAIQLHAFAALTVFVLGVVQLTAPKGTLPHRTLGWVWVALMAVVAGSSFFIHEIRLWGRGARSISCRYSRSSCWRSACGMPAATACAATASPWCRCSRAH